MKNRIVSLLFVFNVSVAPGQRIACLFRGDVVACILYTVYKKGRLKPPFLFWENRYIKTKPCWAKTTLRISLCGKAPSAGGFRDSSANC